MARPFLQLGLINLQTTSKGAVEKGNYTFAKAPQ